MIICSEVIPLLFVPKLSSTVLESDFLLLNVKSINIIFFVLWRVYKVISFQTRALGDLADVEHEQTG